MKNLEEFIESLVKIEYIENSNCFGHYPFQMFVETNDGNFELNSLALGGDVEACYNRFAHYIINKAKRVYLSLDFPQGGDITNDFVAIFSFENGEINIIAIPYQESDGKSFEIIKESKHLDVIKSQLIKHL